MSTAPRESASDLTWSSLLAHWTEMARSALALPTEGEGGRWRAAVAPVIGLQAITFALAELDRLPAGERAAGLDRAEVGARRYAAELHDIWKGMELPGEVVALVEDARRALTAARGAGVEWRITSGRLVADHPAELVEAIVAMGFAGDLYVPVGNETLFAPSPVAFAREPDGSAPGEDVIRAVDEFFGAELERARTPGVRQVYRQFDFATGRAVRDLVMPLEGGLPPGRPLLAAAVLGGRAQLVPMLPRPVGDLPDVPVRFEHGEA